MRALVTGRSKSSNWRALVLAIAMACAFLLIEWLAFTDKAKAAVLGATNPVANSVVSFGVTASPLCQAQPDGSRRSDSGPLSGNMPAIS